jgi:hypothetical protein
VDAFVFRQINSDWGAVPASCPVKFLRGRGLSPTKEAASSASGPIPDIEHVGQFVRD